jgi:hypothetical protein
MLFLCSVLMLEKRLPLLRPRTEHGMLEILRPTYVRRDDLLQKGGQSTAEDQPYIRLRLRNSKTS